MEYVFGAQDPLLERGWHLPRRTGQVSLLAVLSLVVATSVVVNTDWGRERTREAALDAFRSQLGLHASLDRVEVDLLPWPRVQVEGVDLRDPVYGPLARARRITVYPSVASLLLGRFKLSRIHLNRPWVRLVVRDGKVRNAPDPGEGGGTDSEFPLNVLKVYGGEVHVDADVGRAHAKNVDLVFHALPKSTFHVQVKTPEVSARHQGRDWNVTGVDVNFTLTPKKLFVRHGSVDTPFASLRASQAFLRLPYDGTYAGTFSLSSDLQSLSELPLDLSLPAFVGRVALDTNVVSDTALGPRARGSLAVRGAAIGRYGLGDADLEFQASPASVEITSGEVRMFKDGGVAQVKARVDFLPGFPISIQANTKGVQFARLMEQLGVTPNTIVQWEIDADTRIRGTLDPLRIAGPIQARTRDFIITREAWHRRPMQQVISADRGDVAGQMIITDKALWFENMVAHTGETTIKSNVHLGFDSRIDIKTTCDLHLVDASPLLDFPLGGSGTVQVNVGGTFSDPTMQGELDVKGFSFNTYDMGNVTAGAQLEKGGLAVRFTDLKATKNSTRYGSDSVMMDFTKHFVLDAEVRLEEAHLEDLYQVFHFEEDERFAEYQGAFRGNTAFHFTLGFPEDSPTGTLDMDLNLEVIHAQINGLGFDGGRFDGRWKWFDQRLGVEGGTLDLEHVFLRKGKGVVRIGGNMALGGGMRFHMVADRLALHETEGFREGLKGLGGIYSVVADVRGTASVPRVDMDVMLTGLSLYGTPLGDGRLFVRLTDKDNPLLHRVNSEDETRGRLEPVPCPKATAGFLAAQWPPDPPIRTVDGLKARNQVPMAYLVCGAMFDKAVVMDMAVGQTLIYPVRGDFFVRGLQLAPLFRFLPSDEPMGGVVDAEAHFNGGSLGRPGTLSGSAVVHRLLVTRGAVSVKNDTPVRMNFGSGRFEVRDGDFSGGGSLLRVSGGGSAKSGLALDMNGSLDLSLLSTMFQDFADVEGAMTLGIHVTGDWNAPRVVGTGTLRDVAFLHRGLGTPVGGLQGDMKFTSKRVLFEGFRAEVAGGDVAMVGAVSLGKGSVQEAEFNFKARDVSLPVDPQVKLTVGGEGQLSWKLGDRLPTLAGEVQLQRAVYEKPIALSRTLGELSRSKRAEVKRYDPDDDRIAFDLRVTQESPIRIQNNLLDASVRLEDKERAFRVFGTDQRMGATGVLTIPQGTFRFRNRDFDIRRGFITFDDPQRLEPNFDLVAFTEIRRTSSGFTGPDWRIQLHAYGTPDNFRLETSSSPTLAQQDILLLLTVGMTRAEADQLQTGDITSTAALEAIAAVTGIDREVQKAVPVIDDFQISSRYSPFTNRTEPQLTVGKRIADRVRLNASTGLSETRQVRTGVQWQLSNQTSVEAVYDNVNSATASQFGNVGVDFRWRLEFD